MSIVTDGSLRLVPVRSTRVVTPTVRILRKTSGYVPVALSQSALALLGRPTHVQVLTDGVHVAVRGCGAKDQHARRISRKGDVTASELQELLALEVGRAVKFPVTLDSGHLVGVLPAESIRRSKREVPGS